MPFSDIQFVCEAEDDKNGRRLSISYLPQPSKE